jgi:hypothetical protein
MPYDQSTTPRTYLHFDDEYIIHKGPKNYDEGDYGHDSDLLIRLTLD